MSSEEDRNWVKTLGLFSLIITDLIATTALGVGGGYLLTQYLGAPQWVLMLTSLIGLILAFYRLIRFTSAESKDGTPKIK